jgi:hypothetical protein
MELGRMRRLAACTLVVGALAPAGAGAALACHGGHQNDHSGVRAASFTVERHGCKSNVLSVASTYLGLPARTIKTDLMNGQSLGQIADATTGHSSAGLVAAFTAAIQAKLNTKVTDSELSATQESTILTNIQPWLQKLVAATWTNQNHSFYSHHR